MSTSLTTVSDSNPFNSGIFSKIDDLVIPAIERPAEVKDAKNEQPTSANQKPLREWTVLDIEQAVNARLAALPKEHRTPHVPDVGE